MADRGSKKKVTITVCGQTFEEAIPRNVIPSMRGKYVEYLRGRRKMELDPSYIYKDMDGREWRLPLSPTAMKHLLPRVEEGKGGELVRRNAEAASLKERLLVLKNECLNGKVGNKVPQKMKALEDEYSGRILEMLGRGFTAAEVHRALLEEGADISYEAIQRMHSVNRTAVAEARGAYNEDVSTVTLYSKRCRLEKLSYLMEELLQDFEKASSPAIRRGAAAEVRQIIESARKEVEGEELKLTVSGKIDIDATIAVASVQNSTLAGLTIAQLVIARAAARLGVRSQYFIDHLSRSWYARWGGFRKNEDLRVKPPYPTEAVYDIMDIGMEQKHMQWASEQASYEIDEQDGKGNRENGNKERMRQKLLELLEKGR